MNELTKAEEQVMQVLWQIKKGFVKDIIEEFSEPKPAYNTISTIVRILVRKKIVDYVSYGKSHQYFPLVSKDAYKTTFFNGFLKRYFSSSFQNLVSFFSRENGLTISELENLKQIMEIEIEKKRKNKN